ncbi:protein-disulfide reductase DsbD domain-containing protein [Leisingera aquaemixtae]|uniref:protein-disulfide reductase DsbD domain-containing protein n=1 Tax=Leisingera aquaemixtae TaxID=1396826 RepID=UPI0021A872BA|nr:protein-disulfide reductase DsbD domain-containing protein [Leisingera aquaemixtae]
MRKTLTKAAACAASLLALAAGSPALSGAAEGGIVEIEVLDGGMTPRGTYMGALRVKLQPGWKTYWRAPGDAGIPPSFSWRGARNVGALSITWPAPEVFLTSGYRTIGYHDQLVLPVEITPETPGKPVRLKGRMQLGVCKDVCVPAELKFDHQLDASAGRNPAIAAALASRPWSAKEAGVRQAACSLRPSEYGMKVTARISMPPAGGEEIAVIEPGNPKLYAGSTTTRREGGLLVAETEFLPADNSAYAIDRSKLRITVLGQNHSVDIQGCSAG